MCQKLPSLVRGWVASWLRMVSMALRYFSSPKMSYRVNRFLPWFTLSRLYSLGS